jgi:hypothetical protein
MQTIKVDINKYKNPLISIDDSTFITSHTRNRFIIMLNNPKVMILIGRDIIFRTGFTKKFANPSINPVSITIFIDPLYSTLGTSHTIKKTAKTPAIKWRIKFLSILKSISMLPII